MLHLPGGHLAQDLLDLSLVADQVVVNNKDDIDILSPERFEFLEDLLAGLDSRLPAKRHDDVAKLALKRTPARKLQATEGVVLHLQQVEPRGRHHRHVRLLDLLVTKLMKPLRPLLEELRPGLLRLANEDDVG